MKKIFVYILVLSLFVSCFNVNAATVSAKAYIVVNAETMGVISGENYNKRLPMASTTKIMTALILAEQNTPQRIVTVTKEMVAVEGSSMGLKVGDKVSFNDLLYGMMLSSGNDAANVTAIAISGSIEEFSHLMNARAKELGLKNTNFVTPSGLDAENHYTTAYDLALLTAFALNNESFYKAVSSYKATLNYGNPPYRRMLTNHNRLLVEYDNAIGVKTGFTKKAGRCLVSAAQRDDKRVICVTLNDPDDWDDHKKLLDYGLNSVTSFTPENQKHIGSIAIFGGEKDRLSVTCDYGFITLLKSEIENLSYNISYNKNLIAPITKGQVVGKITYKLNNKEIKSFKIVALENVKAINESFSNKFICSIKLLLN